MYYVNSSEGLLILIFHENCMFFLYSFYKGEGAARMCEYLTIEKYLRWISSALHLIYKCDNLLFSPSFFLSSSHFFSPCPSKWPIPIDPFLTIPVFSDFCILCIYLYLR